MPAHQGHSTVSRRHPSLGEDFPFLSYFDIFQKSRSKIEDEGNRKFKKKNVWLKSLFESVFVRKVNVGVW